jgi:hypothetical protein
MLARLATFNSPPSDVEDPNVQLLRQTIKDTPGFVAGYHLLDPQTGKAMSLVIVNDADGARAMRQALAARPSDKQSAPNPTVSSSFKHARSSATGRPWCS